MNKGFITVLVVFISFFAYGIYTNLEKNSQKKEKRLACQKETITFEKVVNKKLLNEAINLLISNNYEIKARIEKSKYMKSKIDNYISIQKANTLLQKEIDSYINKKVNLNKKLLIDYYILENDKEDMGKKSEKAKLYEGYLVFEFKLDKKLVYKIQTDYMKKDGSDIANRISCAIKSFISLKN